MQICPLQLVEEETGAAKYMGLSSPAMTTTTVGARSASVVVGLIVTGLSSASIGELEDCFRREQTRIINDMVMSPNIKPKLIKR
ncbi:unnamed protein product [Ilex paraguariensis]|uniref:Uncharacterized protein n=1 Tax=Ilex paraguariensis TaxID=185542 RepID=A0ABC8RHH9_9AQUA